MKVEWRDERKDSRLASMVREPTSISAMPSSNFPASKPPVESKRYAPSTENWEEVEGREDSSDSVYVSELPVRELPVSVERWFWEEARRDENDMVREGGGAGFRVWVVCSLFEGGRGEEGW